ncbi:cytochrome C oxidase subunit I [uncultured Roseobacter sp.]|uniref:cytochrome C oxidase subunit I n=1 Tax=uncultured Roseobacter sp. TaxID=114847 RepID=UPI002616B5ED|nr:cytochrome C oxidase subunit I [uncultured Roseobacter sp.]
MQTTILLITLVLMAATLALILRAVLATDGPPPSDTAPKTRIRLLWTLVVFGVVLSVATLREWPHTSAGSDSMVVNITSGQWWWETDTTEIPLGQQVEFHVTSDDVNHGLGIYDPDMRLVVQVQAMPTYTNKVVHTFDQPGTYQILCMEFCGIAHHDMAYEFDVVEENS